MTRIVNVPTGHAPLAASTRVASPAGATPSNAPVLDQFVASSQGASPAFEMAHLQHAFPANLDVTGTLSDRIARFAARWPNQVRIIPNIGFEFKENVPPARRSLTVISLEPPVSSREPIQYRAALRSDYVRAVAANTVAFTMPKEPFHLYTRFGQREYDLNGIGFRDGGYAPFTTLLEPLIELSPREMARMAEYVASGLAKPNDVFGAFTSKEGAQDTNGKLSDNRPKEGKHNCTTWITTAPVGDAGEQLRDLVMAPRKWLIHDNPGWWGKFLVGASRSPRCQNVVYWVNKPVEDAVEDLPPGSILPWNFDEQ